MDNQTVVTPEAWAAYASILLVLLIGLTSFITWIRKLQLKYQHWQRKRTPKKQTQARQYRPELHHEYVPHQTTARTRKPVYQQTLVEVPVSVATVQNPYAVDGVPQALKKPPLDFMETVNRLEDKPYSFPLGWSIDGLKDAQFVGDVNHIALTGQSDSGKDNAALGILMSLALYHTPQELQFALIDGKGLDWIDFADKEHTWLLAAQAEDIPDAMERLTAERKRRYTILSKAKVQKWDHYKGGDLPLLIVFVSELSLLEGAVGKKSELTDWLNAELTSARAFGIRYIIAAQTMSNFDTRWRSQIGLYIAGYQPNESQDMPNCGFSSKELAERGTKAPSDLPVPSNVDSKGIFCIVKGRDSVNVRTAYISPEQRLEIMQMLPDKPQESNVDLLERLVTSDVEENELQTAMALTELVVDSTATTDSTEMMQLSDGARISVVEVERILDAAKTAKHRSALSTTLYGRPAGAGYNKVKSVCNHYGIL